MGRDIQRKRSGDQHGVDYGCMIDDTSRQNFHTSRQSTPKHRQRSKHYLASLLDNFSMDIGRWISNIFNSSFSTLRGSGADSVSRSGSNVFLDIWSLRDGLTQCLEGLWHRSLQKSVQNIRALGGTYRSCAYSFVIVQRLEHSEVRVRGLLA